MLLLLCTFFVLSIVFPYYDLIKSKRYCVPHNHIYIHKWCAPQTMEKLAVIRAWAEVYIVAVDREKEREREKKVMSEREGDETECYDHHSGESLLSLVQPELENLSRHWFSALK